MTAPIFKVPKGQRLIQDLYNAIMDDSWFFGVIWGEQRCGKSSLALWLGYFLWRMLDPSLDEEQLWNYTINSNIYSLTQLMYRIKSPSVPRIWELKHRHHRVPYTNWDDFGANANKADTQHSRAWDKFKGGFDVLGTKMSALICTMTTPDQPTSQLLAKYTAEIHIPVRGMYKYDKVVWQQDFRGWHANKKKDWQQELCSFGEIPDKWYMIYDEQRMTLCDEVIIGIEDELVRELPWIMKRTSDMEITLLQRIINEGVLSSHMAKKHLGGGEEANTAIKRAKSHQLIVAESRGGHTFFDISNLGMSLLTEYNKGAEDE